MAIDPQTAKRLKSAEREAVSIIGKEPDKMNQNDTFEGTPSRGEKETLATLISNVSFCRPSDLVRFEPSP